MIPYYVYNDASGEILRTGACVASDLSLQAGTGETAVQAEADDATEYHDTGTDTLTAKSSFSVSTSITGLVLTITGVPDGTTVTVVETGDSDTINDASGQVDITFDVSGDYTVTLEQSPQYITETLEVTV